MNLKHRNVHESFRLNQTGEVKVSELTYLFLI